MTELMTNIKKLIMTVALGIIFFPAQVMAFDNESDPVQCSKFGPDSNRTLDEVSLYVELYEQESYDAAKDHWRYVFHNAPGFHEGVHIAGIRMYQHYIDNETDSVAKEQLIDTLMMIYDQRIACFGKPGYNYGRKAYDMMKYRPYDIDAIYATYEKAFNAEGELPEYFLIVPYVKLSGNKYRTKQITAEEMFALYQDVTRAIESVPADNRYAPQYAEAKNQIIQYLTEIGILDCSTLKPYYTEKYQEDPNNQAIWAEAASMLSDCGCDQTLQEIFKKAYNLEPNYNAARSIASCALEMGQTSEAIKYFEEAFQATDDQQKKSIVAYRIARIYYDQKSFSTSREWAYKAAKFNPNWGDPYILIGRMYAASGSLCGSGTGFESQVVVWPAIDKWNYAKSIDPSVASEANSLISQYSEYMPTKADLFQREIQIGSPYTVGCWIGESTTVRAKP